MRRCNEVEGKSRRGRGKYVRMRQIAEMRQRRLRYRRIRTLKVMKMIRIKGVTRMRVRRVKLKKNNDDKKTNTVVSLSAAQSIHLVIMKSRLQGD